ncbi:steroid receptor RNA activator 1-like isoform X2 [Panulirus ornatus]|uniref:steroid receptor RNA activator 1-like isoform X2 n=1 Tax=Panulirus ornatus TaxID=150431 RepID=UPI003A8704CA
MDPIEPGNHERAWNDPPKFAFNAGSAVTPGGSGGRRRLLNKRVPVPIGPSGSSSPMPPAMRPSDTPPIRGQTPLRPPSAGPPPIHPPSVNHVHDIKANNPVDDATREVEDCRDFQEILEEVEVALKNSLQSILDELKDNVREEITKRLHLMKTMWMDEKLNVMVQKRMLALARALTKEEYDTAWALHQGLIVDYTSICSPWMVGVKTLITECRNQSKHRATDAISCVLPGGGGEEVKNEVTLDVNSVGKIIISEKKCNNGEEGKRANATGADIASGSCDSDADNKKETSKVFTSE